MKNHCSFKKGDNVIVTWEPAGDKVHSEKSKYCGRNGIIDRIEPHNGFRKYPFNVLYVLFDSISIPFNEWDVSAMTK